MAPTQLVSAGADTVARFERKLTDQGTSLAEKYRILFSLRNISGDQAHAAMLTGLRDQSALYRHEVAYCLGQRQDPAAVQALKAILQDTSEHGMVRHEAGEALGAIGTPDCMDPLREHEHDAVREVAETCQLAMQRIRFFESSEGKQLMDDSPYNSVVGIELDRDARSARSHALTDSLVLRATRYALRYFGRIRPHRRSESLSTSFGRRSWTSGRRSSSGTGPCSRYEISAARTP